MSAPSILAPAMVLLQLGVLAPAQHHHPLMSGADLRQMQMERVRPSAPPAARAAVGMGLNARCLAMGRRVMQTPLVFCVENHE